MSNACKSFTLNLNEIKIIAISPRLLFDDESIFIIVIDTSNQIYLIPAAVIGTKGLVDFENYFKLKPIIEEWGKFEYNDHYSSVDKIIYPKEMYWINLFKKDWKLKVRRLYSWVQPKTFYGNLNEAIK